MGGVVEETAWWFWGFGDGRHQAPGEVGRPVYIPTFRRQTSGSRVNKQLFLRVTYDCLDLLPVIFIAF